MTQYALNLPTKLQREAEQWAAVQGISLDQFVLWAVTEKVGDLKHQLDDPIFPHVTYRRGASGWPTPVLRGTGIRVQTIVITAHNWGLSPAQIATEYGLTVEQVNEALDFYVTHRTEIDTTIAAEQSLEQAHV